MIALFNKSGLGTDELRLHCSFLDANMKYDKISPQVEFESEEIRNLIGNATYQRALTHYQSASYNVDGEQDATRIILNRLVYLIQAPVSNFAYLAFAPHNDINHTGNGRAIHVSEDSKPAFEWQVIRSEEALHRTAHRQVDQLLAFLEENKAILTEWKDSAERKQNFDLLISDASLLDGIYPIDRSRWLYTKLSPFLREYQEDVIIPVIGEERITELSNKLTGTDPLAAADKKLLSFIRKPMALYAVALGLKRLSMKFFPDGIAQGYQAERTNVKASQVASEGGRYRLAQDLEADAKTYLQVLVNHISSLEAEAGTEPGTFSDLDIDDDLEDPCKEPYFSA